MARKKEKFIDETAVFYLSTIRRQGFIKTWEEATAIYFILTGNEITAADLSRTAKNTVFSTTVNPSKFFEYCAQTDALTKKVSIPEEKQVVLQDSKDTIIRTLSIPNEDYKPVFGIDINQDSKETIRKKIMNKISDDIFLLNYLGFHPGRFEIGEIVSGAWTTPVKVEKDNVKSIEVILNEKFSVVVKKRKVALLYHSKEECDKWLEDFLRERKLTPFDLFDEQHKMTPSIHISKPNMLHENTLMVCPGLELHLGKLGSVVDFEDYSTKQAMWRIKKVAKEILQYQRESKASQLLLGIGNDYFNTDTVDDKTTAGTPQNNDTRFKEVYMWGKIGQLRLIETVKEYFDKVIIKGMPGNHDEKSSFSLFTNLYDIYAMKEDPKVEVPFSYKDLRYTTCHEYGKNLIVFTHGKSPEGKNLSDKILAESVRSQFPEECHRAHNVYVFAGHLHQDSETQFENTNIRVIRTASLSGVDSWHSSNAYLGQRQGHSVYLIHKTLGYLGKRNITVGEDEKQQKINNIKRSPDTNVHKAYENAINLSEKSVLEERVNKRYHVLEKKEAQVQIKYDKLIEAISMVLGVDFHSLSSHQKEHIFEILGYQNELKELTHEKTLLKKYMN